MFETGRRDSFTFLNSFHQTWALLHPKIINTENRKKRNRKNINRKNRNRKNINRKNINRKTEIEKTEIEKIEIENNTEIIERKKPDQGPDPKPPPGAKRKSHLAEPSG